MRSVYTPLPYMRIQDLAHDDRPREKLFNKGSGHLSNAELLAILIGSGIQRMTAIDLAKHILKEYDQSPQRLATASVQELQRFEGIGFAKACVLMSAIELAKRYNATTRVPGIKIKKAEQAYKYIKPTLTGKVTEECWALLLNSNLMLIKSVQISKGGLVQTVIDPKVVFKVALEHSTKSMVIIHNHPSGNPLPSKADEQITEKLLQGARYFDIELLDHLVFTDYDYYSFADHHKI